MSSKSMIATRLLYYGNPREQYREVHERVGDLGYKMI
jgi:hypothetical protein